MTWHGILSSNITEESNSTNNFSFPHHLGHHGHGGCQTSDGTLNVYTTNGLLLVIFKVMAFCFVIVSNVAIITGLLKTKQTKMFTYKIFILMCITDMGVACFTNPISVVGLFDRTLIPCKLTEFKRIYEQAFVLFNFFNTFSLSLDRYLFVAQQELYRKLPNAPRFIITATVPLSISITTVMVIRDIDVLYSTTIYTGLAVLLFLLTCLFNILLIRFVSRCAKIMRRKSAHKAAGGVYNRRVNKTILYISLIFLVTSLPCMGANIYLIVQMMKKSRLNSSIFDVFTYIKFPILLNSGLTAIVITARNPKLKRYFKGIVKSCFQKNQTVEISAANNLRRGTINEDIGTNNLALDQS